MNRWVPRDEREVAVDLHADRVAFLVLSFGLLVAVMYRAFVLDEASWDLIGLVVLAGPAGLAYRVWAGVATGRWLAFRFATVTIGAIVAFALVLVLLNR